MFRNCKFAFKCSAQWDRLLFTENPDIKFCTKCDQEVHLVHSDQELAESIRLNRCVAIADDPLTFFPFYAPWEPARSPSGKKRLTKADKARIVCDLVEIARHGSDGLAKELTADRMSEATKLGQARGYLTFTDIEHFLGTEGISAESMAKLGVKLNALGIHLLPASPTTLGSPSVG